MARDLIRLAARWAKVARLPGRGSVPDSVIDAVGSHSVAAGALRSSRPDTVPILSHVCKQGVVPVPEVKLTAERRTEFGKGAARRIRRADKVPAVLYGHGTDPVHITLPGHATMLALKHSQRAALHRDRRRRASSPCPSRSSATRSSGTIEHVDLFVVRRGEKVTVDVPIHIDGDAAPDTLVDRGANTIAIEAEATHIPAGRSARHRGPARRHPDPRRATCTLPEGADAGRRPEILLIVNSHPGPVGRGARGRAGRGRGRGRHRAPKR